MTKFTFFAIFAIFLLFQNSAMGQLSGTKTIGASGADYVTITEAITELSQVGINADVIFNIKDGLYNEKISIADSIKGSNIFNITFQSESKDTSKVKIFYDATTSNQYLVELTLAQNIQFNNITFELSGNYSCRVFKLKNGIKSLKITDCTIKVTDKNPSLVELTQPFFGEIGSSDLYFSNNLLVNGYSAIKLAGGYYGTLTNVIIENNNFMNQMSCAIELKVSNNITVKQNSITTLQNSNSSMSDFGIGLEYCKDFEISKNEIYSSLYNGILINNCQNESALKKSIFNNFVTTKVQSISGSSITVQESNFVDVIHNSFQLVGEASNWSNQSGLFTNNSNLNVVNNIFQNEIFAAVNLDTVSGILMWDYNCLFGAEGKFVRYNNASLANFDAWKASTGIDSHSVTGSLVFKSETDLHLKSLVLDSMGTPWPEILKDIDGEPRNITTPDIGADEFEVVNDKPEIKNQEFVIDENPAIDLIVGTVEASDADIDQTLVFTIVEGNENGALAINSATGVLTVALADVFDFETVSSTTITVRVTDDGEVPLSNSAQILIILNDVNENPIVADQMFVIGENSSNAMEIGVVLAIDPDVNQTLSYSIIGTNNEGAVAINEQTGMLIVADSSLIDFESVDVIELTVSITDNGAIPLSSEAIVSIILTDTNETPIIENQTFAIDENSANEAVVGTVLASDTDLNQILKYSIKSESIAGSFTINEETGLLTVNNSTHLDYELNVEFTLVVEVTDNAPQPLSATAEIIITVNDLVETGIQASLVLDANVYPNPSNGELNFSGDLDNANVEIYSLEGKMLYAKDVNTKMQSVVITNYKGLVLILITKNNEQKNLRILIE